MKSLSPWRIVIGKYIIQYIFDIIVNKLLKTFLCAFYSLYLNGLQQCQKCQMAILKFRDIGKGLKFHVQMLCVLNYIIWAFPIIGFYVPLKNIFIMVPVY